MTHHLATALLLAAAFALYGLGLAGAGDAFLLLGAVCELWFWARVAPGLGWLSRKRPR